MGATAKWRMRLAWMRPSGCCVDMGLLTDECEPQPGITCLLTGPTPNKVPINGNGKTWVLASRPLNERERGLPLILAKITRQAPRPASEDARGNWIELDAVEAATDDAGKFGTTSGQLRSGN